MHDPVAIGVDIGTTTICAVAVGAADGRVASDASVANDAETTTPSDRALGRSEWDAQRMFDRTCEAVRECVRGLGGRAGEIAGLALTGQQHGVVLADHAITPVTPFIGWQDRRCDASTPDGRSWAAHARAVLGDGAAQRAGCALATGYMGTTLYWLKQHGILQSGTTACFITDFVASALTGCPPVTDPTMGASSGLIGVRSRGWDQEIVGALGLGDILFPEVREASSPVGAIGESRSGATGLPVGTPVFVGLGDNQASFLGSVASPEDTVLVNVGTGAQVARFAPNAAAEAPLELRPFPRTGNLIVHAGLSGGRSYAVLESFLRSVLTELGGHLPDGHLYERMNTLAAAVPAGAGGLRCDATFAGTRLDPERRATWTGISDLNLTPGNLVRSVLEGMARSFREGSDLASAAVGRAPAALVCSGNGIRRNRVLADAISAEFGLPARVPHHLEEAAFGAALVAGVGAGIWRDLAEACTVIRYV